MLSKEHTTSSLDDSLTNIQWLCKLESNPLLETEQKNLTTGEPTRMDLYPKPPFSYATLILLAINSTSEKRMTLQDIYKWIENNFPFYKNCKKAWKNSIRHNLSLHSYFLKAQRPSNLPGKGSYWSISPEGKENIMKEVMKHQQPLMNQNMTLEQSNTKGLRPILPKPSADRLMTDTFLNQGGVQILTDGRVNGLPGSIPVVILPTQLYMNMATKIAAQAAAGNTTAVGVSPTLVPIAAEAQRTTNPEFSQPVPQSEELGEERETIVSEIAITEEEIGSGCSISVTQVLQENCENNSATVTVEQALCKIEKRENENSSENCLNSASIRSEETCKSPSTADVKTEKTGILALHVKKTGANKRKSKPYSKSQKSLCVQRKQDLQQPKRSPLRPRPQLTLAAINSQANEMPSPGHIFCKHNNNDFNCLSPLKPLITPTKNLDNQSFLASLLVSPPGYNNSGHTGFTPPQFSSDSGFFSPFKEGTVDYGFLFSPERFANSKVCSTPQSCRKSLGLGLTCKNQDKKVDEYDTDFARL